MKFFPVACCLLFLTTCGQSDRSKLIDELGLVIDGVAYEKMEEAEHSLTMYKSAQRNGNITPENFSEIANVHQRAERFYRFVDGFKEKYRYHSKFPKAELVQRFRLSYDSISHVFPERAYPAFDYSQSAHLDHLLLTITRMKLDIANLEIRMMTGVSEKYWVTIFRDDFSKSNPQN